MQILKNVILTSQHNQKKFGLDIFYKDNQTSKPCILFVHGFNGFKDWGHFDLIAKFFAEHGYVFIKFNLSHNGTSLEKPTEFVDLEAYGHDYYTRDLDDIAQVIDYLYINNHNLPTKVNLEKIFLLGHSRGGGLSILKTAEDLRIKALTTWASISDVSFFWKKERLEILDRDGVVYYKNGRTKQNLPIYKAYYDNIQNNKKRLNIREKIAEIKVPILLIHGKDDEAVPLISANTLAKSNPNAETLWIENASHTFGGKHPYHEETLPKHCLQACEKTVSFFNKFRKGL